MNRTVERIVASPSREREVGSTSGWVMLPVVALLPFVAAGTFLAGVATGTWPLLPAAFALLGLVESAITDLQAGGIVELDVERRAAMVSNLMVVLCSDSEARPVINTGTLYN